MFTGSSKISNAASPASASNSIKSYSPSGFRSAKLKPLPVSPASSSSSSSSPAKSANVSPATETSAKISNTAAGGTSDNTEQSPKGSPARVVSPKMDSKVKPPSSPKSTVVAPSEVTSHSKKEDVEIVNSLASNLDSSLTVNATTSSETSTLSLESSSNSPNANGGVYTSNNIDIVTNQDSSANNSSSVPFHESTSKSNATKFGTPVPNRVFVGGIPLDATEYDVRQLFAQHGTIHSVKIITDRAGVSRGYGFVTYENEGDAQKVIKEAENLIIKNRKLNVSTAVMKHQQNSFDPRVGNNGPLLYPHLPFANTTNYNQFYESYPNLCPAEGLPIYQIAGLNSHFISNCASFITSQAAAAQYVNQSAANATAFPSPYQNTTGYLYPPGAATTSIQLPSAAAAAAQHHHHPALFHPQPQHANQHLYSNASMQPVPSHAFHYSNAAPQSGVTSSNSPTIHNLRYSLQPPPSHPHSSNQSSQQVNLNGMNGQQQYIQFSSTTSPGISHPSMHLATLPMHPQSHYPSIQMNPGTEISNSTVSTTAAAAPSTNMPSGVSTQLNPAILHTPTHAAAHQTAPLYANYASTMANSHSLTSNSSQLPCVQNLHVKSDSTGMEIYDNNPPQAILNTPGINANGSAGSSGPPQLHLANNGYMPQMMEVMWSPPQPTTTYGSNMNNISNYQVNGSSGGSKTIPPNRTSSSSSSNNATSNGQYSKPVQAHNSSNSHSANSSNLPTPATTNSSNGSSNSSNCVTSKDKPAPLPQLSSNPRYNVSSYCPSHKKMYNGNGGNGGYSSSSIATKSKLINGNVINNNSIRYSNSLDSDQSPDYGLKPVPAYKTMNAPQINRNAVINSSPLIAQNFVTKTVNGVQIYALAGNPADCSSAEATVNPTSPPATPGSGNVASNTISYKS